MNELTEKNINEAIDWLQKTGGSIQDFAVEQAPLYCREVVAWELWSNSLASGGCVLAAVSLVVFLWKNRERIIEALEEVEVIWSIAGIAAVFLLFPLCFTAGQTASAAVRAAVAPRLVIVEHLRGLK